jgi:hypothetical protein
MIGNRATEVEQLRQQDENNMVQWNQLLGEKDSQILELQDKLDGLLQPRMNSARSREELEAIADSEGGLVAVTKQLKNISVLLMVSLKNQLCSLSQLSIFSRRSIPESGIW